MRHGWRRSDRVLLVLALVCAARPRAGEGMWTFDNPPRAQWKNRYGFEPTDAWLDHLRLSSEKLPNRYLYVDDDEGSRAIAVHSEAILEALTSMYGAEPLVAELIGPAP